MKEIKKERTVFDCEYEACDGSIFKTKEECIKYEKTAQCVIRKKFNDLIEFSSNECSLFNCGSDDYIIDFIKPSTQDAVNTIMQMLELCNTNDNRARKLIKEAQENNDYLLIGHSSYDVDYYYIWDTRTSIFNKIKDNLFFDIKKVEK